MRIIVPGTIMRTRVETEFDPMDPNCSDQFYVPAHTNVLVVFVWTGTVSNSAPNHWVEVLWDGRKGFVFAPDLEAIDAGTE
jgi:hypothetical protein